MGRATPRDSAVMLAALGILAYAASMMTHEAIGHGGYCLVAGGHNTVITPWWETCHFPGKAELGTKAAGPAVQFGAGLLAWLGLHRLPPRAVTLRCFLWLYMVYDLLVSSGYVAFSGVTGAGDTAELVTPLHASIAWRCGLILFGSVAYFLAMRAAAYELKRFAGRDNTFERLFRLVWIPYTSIAIFACCTAVMNQVMSHGVAHDLAAASPSMNRVTGTMGMAVASSFGAGLGMFGLPAMQRGIKPVDASPAPYLPWSAAWGVVAGMVIVAFWFYIGPGPR